MQNNTLFSDKWGCSFDKQISDADLHFHPVKGSYEALN